MSIKYLLILCVATIECTIDWDNVQPGNIYVPVSEHVFGDTFRSRETRIVGGDEVKPHSYPFMVYLVSKTLRLSMFCGGSLISRNYVLTAAHCVDGAISVTVTLGAHFLKIPTEGTEILTSKQFKIHEQWDKETLSHDIAVIRLPKTVTISENISVVRLPSKSYQFDTYYHQKVTTCGWGLMSDSNSNLSPVLREATTNVISTIICSFIYDIVTSSNICVSGNRKSACHGDSGGPLFVGTNNSFLLIGVVSCGSINGCEAGDPVVYSRVTSFLDWIQQNTDVQIT